MGTCCTNRAIYVPCKKSPKTDENTTDFSFSSNQQTISISAERHETLEPLAPIQAAENTRQENLVEETIIFSLPQRTGSVILQAWKDKDIHVDASFRDTLLHEQNKILKNTPKITLPKSELFSVNMEQKLMLAATELLSVNKEQNMVFTEHELASANTVNNEQKFMLDEQDRSSAVNPGQNIVLTARNSALHPDCPVVEELSLPDLIDTKHEHATSVYLQVNELIPESPFKKQEIEISSTESIQENTFKKQEIEISSTGSIQENTFEKQEIEISSTESIQENTFEKQEIEISSTNHINELPNIVFADSFEEEEYDYVSVEKLNGGSGSSIYSRVGN